MKYRSPQRKAVYIVIVLLLVLVMVFSAMQILQGFSVMPETDGGLVTTKTIVRDGVEYFPRQDITVFLVIGIDRFGVVEESDYHTNQGDADMISLLIFDETEKTIKVLTLNRDTMVTMPILGLGGKPAGTRFAQLTLSHTYGSGLHDSCENVKQTVSDFLGGLRIDYYLSMNMEAVSRLNDAVGGVKVNVTEDFSAVDPTITMGEMVLNGQQALNYVRTRKDVGSQMNLSRMARQNEYMEGFQKALWNKFQQDELFAVTAYDAISDYIVTDCTANTLNTLFSRYHDYTLEGVVTPEGENRVGDKYMEFYPDAEALDDLIVQLFYSPKD